MELVLKKNSVLFSLNLKSTMRCIDNSFYSFFDKFNFYRAIIIFSHPDNIREELSLIHHFVWVRSHVKLWIIQHNYISSHLHIISVSTFISHFDCSLINFNLPFALIAVGAPNQNVGRATSNWFRLILDVDRV